MLSLIINLPILIIYHRLDFRTNWGTWFIHGLYCLSMQICSAVLKNGVMIIYTHNKQPSMHFTCVQYHITSWTFDSFVYSYRSHDDFSNVGFGCDKRFGRCLEIVYWFARQWSRGTNVLETSERESFEHLPYWLWLIRWIFSQFVTNEWNKILDETRETLPHTPPPQL